MFNPLSDRANLKSERWKLYLSLNLALNRGINQVTCIHQIQVFSILVNIHITPDPNGLVYLRWRAEK